jgi:hypothetical protein
VKNRCRTRASEAVLLCIACVHSEGALLAAGRSVRLWLRAGATERCRGHWLNKFVQRNSFRIGSPDIVVKATAGGSGQLASTSGTVCL